MRGSMIKTPGSPEDSYAFNSRINYDPATAMVVGTAINVGGNLLGADAAMQSGNYQKDIHDRNAGIYETKSDQAINIGERNVAMFNDAFESQMASTETALLNSGVRMEGTALELIQHSYGQAEIERQNIMYDALVASYDFKEQAVASRSQGDMAMFQARSQRASAFINSVGSVVGTYGQIKYMDKAAASTKAMIDITNANATAMINAQANNNMMLMDMTTANTIALTDLNNSLSKSLFNTSMINSLKAINNPLGVNESGNLLTGAK